MNTTMNTSVNTTSTASTTSRLGTAAYLAAPALLGVYGVIRLLDGTHGPGPGWITGHLALLASLLLFGVVFHSLHRLAATRGRVAAGITFWLAAAGLAGSLGQVGIDLYVGSRAADLAAQNRLFEQIQSHPGVLPAFYTVLPLFFYLGLLSLLTVLALRRQIRAWSLLLAITATAVMGASLDLMPLGALLLALSLTPQARRATVRLGHALA